MVQRFQRPSPILLSTRTELFLARALPQILSIGTRTLNRKTFTKPEDAMVQSISATSSPSRNALGPTNSFIDVLGEMSLDTGQQKYGEWARPAPSERRERRKTIKFQKLDIREANDISGRSQIHLFGVTKDGYSILARVLDFSQYFYYPAPQGFTEDDSGPLCQYINDLLSSIDSPAVSEIQLEPQRTSSNGQSLQFLKISLFDHRKMRSVKGVFTSGRCQYRDLFSSPELSYEASVPYFLRFMLDNNILSMTWLQLPKEDYTFITPEKRVSRCQLEVSISVESLRICNAIDNREKFAPLRILSLDIECDVNANGQISDARNEAVLQIGNMVAMHDQDLPFNRTIFTLGSCSPIAGTHVLSFEDESEMLLAWSKFFIDTDPDVVIGYNITQFDIPYLLSRARTLDLRGFPFLGRIKDSPQILNKRRPNFFECPGYEGRLLIDIYFHIKEHFPNFLGEGAYKLNAISKHFLDDTKEDVHYTQIPILHRGDSDSRRQLALYCLKDVYLPLLLLRKLKCFEKEVKLARDACIPYNTLRVWNALKIISRRCINAISGEYVAVDAQ